MPWSSDSASAAKSSATMINSYIDSVSAIYSKSVSHLSNPSSSLPARVTSFFFTPVRESDVSNALASMALTNSSRTDGITLHKRCMSSPEILSALSYICNLSIYA